MIQRTLAITLLGLACLAIGCADDGGLKPVTGLVTLDGQPVGGIDVVFVPVEGGRTNSIARTNAEGRFTLTYTSQHTGAMPGEYKVLFKREEPETGRELLPERFSSGGKTTLRATVEEGGDNEFNFEIESK